MKALRLSVVLCLLLLPRHSSAVKFMALSPPSPPVDWSSSFELILDFETTNGSYLENKGFFGSGYDFSAVGNVSSSTPLIPPEAVRAAGAGGGSDYSYCPSCQSLVNSNNSLSWGCWASMGNGSGQSIVSTFNANPVSGWEVERRGTERIRCSISSNSVTGATSLTGDNVVNYGCVFNLANQSLEPFIDGRSDAAPITGVSSVVTTNELRLWRRPGGSNTTAPNSVFDECYVIKKALTAKQMCRLAAVGISGNKGACDTLSSNQYQPCGTNSDCDTGIGEQYCDDVNLSFNSGVCPSGRCCVGDRGGGRGIGGNGACSLSDCDASKP